MAHDAAVRPARFSLVSVAVIAILASLVILLVIERDHGRSGPAVLYGINEDALPATFPLQQRLGAPVRRLVVYWSKVEPQPGRRVWAEYDAAVGGMRAAGLRPLLVAFSAPCWAVAEPACVSGGAFPPDRAHLGAWGRFVAALSKRYDDAVGVEVWNEPNLGALYGPRPDPRSLGRLLEVAHAAVAERMPVISGGLLAGSPAEGPVRTASAMAAAPFLRELLLTLGGRRADGIGIHLYPGEAGGGAWDPERALDAVRALRRARAQSGSRLPFWVTETGESTAAATGYPVPVSPGRQARDLLMLVRRLAEDPDIRAVLVHRLTDQPDPRSVEAGFGLFRADGTPKAAACSLARYWGGSLRC